MEQILILASILISGYLAHRIFFEQPVAFRMVGALVIFTSTVALSGFAAGSIGAAVNGYAVFAGSALLLAIGLMVITRDQQKMRRHGIAVNHGAAGSSNGSPHGATWAFLTILFSWLALSLNISSGLTTPHGGSVDAAAHYALVRYLNDFARLPGTDWPFLWEIAHYPFGFHLTTVITSRLVDASPFYIMWILAALFMGVVVASVSSMIFSDAEPKGLIKAGLITIGAFIMFAVSPYVTESYGAAGFYPMVHGLVYIAMFLWFLRNASVITRCTILFVSIALSGMALTYPQWIPILSLFYLYVVAKDPSATRRQQIVALLIPALCSGAVGLAFLIQHWAGLKYIYNIEGDVERNFGYLALLIIGAFAAMHRLWRRQHTRYWAAAIIVGAQVVLVVINKSINGLGGMYPLYKYAYVMAPILILMLAQGVAADKSEAGYARYKPVLTIAIFLSIALASGLNNGHVWKARPCITENEFHAFEWVKNNVKRSDINYFGLPPMPLFGYAITGKPQFNGNYGWWVKPLLDIPRWLSQARSGEAAVVAHDAGDVKKYIDDGKLKVLHVEGDCYVVEKP